MFHNLMLLCIILYNIYNFIIVCQNNGKIKEDEESFTVVGGQNRGKTGRSEMHPVNHDQF